ncbi:MAG TPA: hypothetical protein VK324_04340 [Tepidisphaeraceae bacterium]|nr:hypothetical protein [Tepidisphaeraceae bacterium]
MAELNYLRIAQILGGIVTEIEPPTFGALGAAPVSAERFRLIRQPAAVASIEASQNSLIADAFEEVREGFEPDRVLVDPTLSKKFIAACRKRGVKAPEWLINKRLQNFRKSSSYGIKLKRTTRDAELDPEPFFYAAELGFVQLSYSRRASVDDVITNPKVGEEFVALCKEIEPTGRAIDFKWAALRLRKMRSFSKPKVEKLLAVDAPQIEERLDLVGTLDRVSLSDVPAEKGLFSLVEQNRRQKYLYVGATQISLRDAFEPFRSARPFMALAGPFWQPRLSEITLSVAVMKKRLFGASARDLSLRLIEERHPLYNIPVHITVGDGDADD